MSVELLANETCLEDLNHSAPLSAKVESIHSALKEHLPFVDRIAADVYDAKTDLLKSHMDSAAEGDASSGQVGIETRLADVPALRDIMHSATPQPLLPDASRPWHISQQRRFQNGYGGYPSTCAMPMHHDDAFVGFVWFNSRRRGVFGAHALRTLEVFGHLIALIIVDDLSKERLLSRVARAVAMFTVQRDQETGAHIDRVAQYARIIARDLAAPHGFDDAFIEKLFLFAPLHDVGKIAIPDSILLKPGKLTPQEFDVMKTHTVRGRQLVDDLIAEFGLEGMEGVATLRNIMMYHHEALNGSGYPLGLQYSEIPIEARITAVADVFDALTSKRPYKEPMSNEQAFEILDQMAGTKLDPECIEALKNHRDEMVQIQHDHQEDFYGIGLTKFSE